MYRRLVAALAGIAIASLLAYAVPRSLVVSSIVRDYEDQVTNRSATLMAIGIDSRLQSGVPLDRAVRESLVRHGERLTVTYPDGRRVRVGALGSSGASDTVQRPLEGGGTLTLELSADLVASEVDSVLQLSLLTAIAVVLFSFLMASFLARRLVRPFVVLSSYAEHVGEDSSDPAPRAGFGEADELAEALERSNARVRELLRREREFSANASHQMRTPLSALRLRIEDLRNWPEAAPSVRDELTASLVEVDRLSDTVSDLLELARSGGIGSWEDVDIHAVATAAVERWEHLFAGAGRRIGVVPTSHHAVVGASARSLDQVLDAILENALDHGAGTVDLSVEAGPDDVALRIQDEGSIARAVSGRAFERSFRSDVSHGSGIGLSLAQTIAEATGCRLSLISRDPTVFEIKIPVGASATRRG